MILIRPEVAMYSAFARLNYKPWFALAEFVDNSLQSALANINHLRKAEGNSYKLKVEIKLEDDFIEISDNAFGIDEKDYARAFLPASPPKDTSGLSEFGLGMKAAASWFSQVWMVRTKALGSHVERTIVFDIPNIVRNNIDQLEPIEQSARLHDHYTTIALQNLNVKPKGRTLDKIRTHLSSIYRQYIRDGLLILKFGEEILSFSQPQLLTAPLYTDQHSTPFFWKKEINVELDKDHRITGWAGLLEKGSVSNAGFSVFRRRRLIQGSAGDAYRPEIIFGKPNMFIYQRLVGELEVHGFSVSHTKDGIQWDEWEEDILYQLRRDINSQPMPLLDQALNYRSRFVSPIDNIKAAANDSAQLVVQHFPQIIEEQLSKEPDNSVLQNQLEAANSDIRANTTASFSINHDNRDWHIDIELINDPAREAWYELSHGIINNSDVNISIRINLSHPFLSRFISPSGDEILLFTRLSVGLSIAEITAREIGVRQAGTLRTNLNDILRKALSGPVKIGEITNV